MIQHIPATRGSAGAEPSVLLISMPWTTLTEPSSGLGLLRAVLDRQGIACRVLHLNLFLLEHLRASTYKELANMYSLNDFLFSGPLDGVQSHGQERILRVKAAELLNRKVLDSRRLGGLEGTVESLLRLRNEVLPAWLEGWADELADQSPTLIGFSCMYDQTIASLALAKLLQLRLPGALQVLGGYAVRPPTAGMLLRSSPWIDAICEGEGEQTLEDLARASVGELALEQVRGATVRDGRGAVRSTAPAPAADLDALPTPNYDDYFRDLERLSGDYQVDVVPRVLPLENSRGCWWGAKSHCVFCGIHDEDLAYRARSAGRTLEAMEALRARYGMNFIRFSDYILPTEYFKTLLPELARRGAPFRLSGEIKANVTEEKFALLAEAGFEEVQPGIESFHSHVLQQMNKGVSALQNVYTLLLGRRYGLRVYYNLLYNFPGDEEADYEALTALLPQLLHLDAPVTCLPAQITRYAPLQASPERFSISGSGAESSYGLIFSRDYLRMNAFELDEFCYYFERTFTNSTHLERLYALIQRVVDVWRELAKAKHAWLYEDRTRSGEDLCVRDRRGAEETLHHLDRDRAQVLRACAAPVSLKKLAERGLPSRSGADSLDVIAEELEQLGLLMREGPRVLSLLSVPPEQYAPDVLAEETRAPRWRPAPGQEVPSS